MIKGTYFIFEAQLSHSADANLVWGVGYFQLGDICIQNFPIWRLFTSHALWLTRPGLDLEMLTYIFLFFMFINKLQVIGSSTTILFFWHFQHGWFVFCEYKVALINTAYNLITVCLCLVLDWDSCSCWWKQCRVLTRLVYEVESNQRCSLSKLGLSHGPTT